MSRSNKYGSRPSTFGADEDDDKRITEEAWQRLTAVLDQEKASPAWAEWERQARSTGAARLADGAGALAVSAVDGALPRLPANVSSTAGVRQPGLAEQPRRRHWVRLATASAAALLLIGLWSTGYGGRALAAMTSTFRVNQLSVVDTNDLLKLQQGLADKGLTPQTIDFKQYGSIAITNDGHVEDLSLADAQRLLAAPIVTPPGFDPASDKLTLVPDTKFTFSLKVKPINRLIAELGGTKKLPDAIDGQPFTLELPQTVGYGRGEGIRILDFKPSVALDSLVFVQMAAPQLIVPEGADVNRIRDVLLDLPLLPETIRTLVSASAASSPYMPLPVPDNGTAVQTSVNGSPAVFEQVEGGYGVLWLKAGRLYGLAGGQKKYSSRTAIMQAAEELAK